MDYELYESKWRKVECNAELDIQEVRHCDTCTIIRLTLTPGALRWYCSTLRIIQGAYVPSW